MSIIIIRNLIPLLTYWLILIIGSIYIFQRGRKIYQLVKGSLIGKITKVLVIALLLEMYSFGILTTVFMFSEEKNLYLVLPVFIIYFIAFISFLKALMLAEAEAKKLTNQK